MNKVLLALAACLLVLHPPRAHAWGATGHEWVSGIAADLLPTETPAFLRTKAARVAIAEFGREPDRSKGSGRTHDAERDPAHFIDLGDNGAVVGVLALSALPDTRGEYDAALNAVGFDQYKVGYLPYAITDGYQQIVKDFAYWRASGIGARTARSAADRTYFRADQRRREALTLRDIGVWTHYVGDASQPQHTSIHYDRWGDPNPNSYGLAKGFHQRFEGAWVRANLNRAEVVAAVPAFRDCGCPVMKRAADFILQTNAEVEALFKLDKRGAFPAPAVDAAGVPIRAAQTDPEAAAFTTKLIASSAAEARDLIVLAWRASATSVVGYPGVPVADITSGKVILTTAMYASD